MDRQAFEIAADEMLVKAGGQSRVYLTELNSGYVFDRNGGWVIDRPASTIKLGILCAALYKAQKRLITLDDRLVCSESDKVPGSGVLQYLSAGTELSLRDMLTLMTIQSDNTATNIIIEYVGIDYINGFFSLCGLADTALRRKLFDTEGIRKGIYNQTTAMDLARLLYDLEKRNYIKGAFADTGLDILMNQQISNMDKHICHYYDDQGNWYRYPVKVGSKSGKDDNVEHDCGIIYTPGSTIILSVLTRNMYPPTATDFIGRLAELAVMYLDPTSLEKTYKNEE